MEDFVILEGVSPRGHSEGLDRILIKLDDHAEDIADDVELLDWDVAKYHQHVVIYQVSVIRVAEYLRSLNYMLEEHNWYIKAVHDGHKKDITSKKKQYSYNNSLTAFPENGNVFELTIECDAYYTEEVKFSGALLYHSTTEPALKSIATEGLTIRPDARGFRTVNRLYVTPKKFSAFILGHEIGSRYKDYNTRYVLVIDSSKVPGHIFYNDPRAKGDAYTYQNIPADAIVKIIDDEDNTYDFNMKTVEFLTESVASEILDRLLEGVSDESASNEDMMDAIDEFNEHNEHVDKDSIEIEDDYASLTVRVNQPAVSYEYVVKLGEMLKTYNWFIKIIHVDLVGYSYTAGIKKLQELKDRADRFTIQVEPWYTWPANARGFVYHATKEENVEEILKNGLKINQAARDFKTVNRIYFTHELESAEFIAKSISSRYEGTRPMVILKIDTSKLTDHKFYDDAKFSGDGIFTYQEIPPSAISRA